MSTAGHGLSKADLDNRIGVQTKNAGSCGNENDYRFFTAS